MLMYVEYSGMRVLEAEVIELAVHLRFRQELLLTLLSESKVDLRTLGQIIQSLLCHHCTL